MPRPMNETEKLIGRVNRCFNSFKEQFGVPDYIEGVSDITQDYSDDYIFNLRVKKSHQWRVHEHVQLVYTKPRVEEWLRNAELFEFVHHGETKSKTQ